jgi:hypothetical protein
VGTCILFLKRCEIFRVVKINFPCWVAIIYILIGGYQLSKELCVSVFKEPWRILCYVGIYTVPQMVEALGYKPRVRSSLVSLEFFIDTILPSHYGPGVDSASNTNEYQKYFLGGKGGRCIGLTTVESSWNVMAHGETREGKWMGNWRMEWVASTLTLPRNMVYPALLPLMRTLWLPVVGWTDAPADLNGLVRFAERPDLVSARVPSHFKRSLPPSKADCPEIWEPQPPGELRACPGLYMDIFAFA